MKFGNSLYVKDNINTRSLRILEIADPTLSWSQRVLSRSTINVCAASIEMTPEIEENAKYDLHLYNRVMLSGKIEKHEEKAYA